jgi:phage gp45-like
MNDGIKQLAARIRNLFSLGEFQKRYPDGRIQVKTVFGRVIEKREAFPYGFKAKAQKGGVLVFCQGGNFDGFEILPILDRGNGPDLEEGDAALYTESGGRVIARNNGTVELFGKDYGGVVKARELRRQLAKLSARLDGVIDALKNSPTAAQDGGAAYKAGIAAALNALTDKEDFSAVASEEVFHGSGQNEQAGQD